METGRGGLLKIDFCCLAYILTSNLLFTSLTAGRWEVGGGGGNKINNPRQSDIQTRSELCTVWLNEPHFEPIKICEAKPGTKYHGDDSGSIPMQLGAGLVLYLVAGDKNTPFSPLPPYNLANIQTSTARLGSSEKKGVLLLCFIRQGAGLWAETSLSQDVNTIVFLTNGVKKNQGHHYSAHPALIMVSQLMLFRFYSGFY